MNVWLIEGLAGAGENHREFFWWNDFELVSALSQILQIRALRMENEALADQKRCEQGQLSPQDLELRRLEQMEPGLTRVQWGDDGSIVMDAGLLHE